MKARNSSGLGVTTSLPVSASQLENSGSCTILTSRSLIFLIASFGAPAGMKMPVQATLSKPSKPSSRIVGT